MINTLLEHVPIKMEAKDDKVIEVNDEDNGNKKVNKDIANKDEGDKQEEYTEEAHDADKEEDEVLDVNQAVTMLISSDEEAELEAQRIQFTGKSLRNKKSHDSKSSRSGSRNSNVSSVSLKDNKENGTGRSNSRNSSNNSSTCTATKDQESRDNAKQTQRSTEQMTTTKYDDVVESVAEQPKIQQQNASPSPRKENNENHNDNLPVATLTSDLRSSLRRQSNNSPFSFVSFTASDCSETTESCGTVYVYLAQQKLIFRCEFCDLKYGDLENLGRHLHETHRLFIQQHGVHEKENQEQQQQQQHPLKVKKEHFQTITDESAVTATTETMATAQSTTTTTQLLPPVALNLDIQSEHSLQSCGNVFVLNHRKLFLICGYCECKYANKELFEKHLRQQHDVFELLPAHNEVNVMPKTEIKEEVFIITEIVEMPAIMNSSLDISTTEIQQQDDKDEVSARLAEKEDEITQAPMQVRQEALNTVFNEVVKEEEEVASPQIVHVTHKEQQNVKPQLTESCYLAEANVIDDIRDSVTSAVISSSMNIVKIPVVLTEKSTAAQISAAEDLNASKHSISSPATFIIEEIQEIQKYPISPKRSSRKSRLAAIAKEKEETLKSPPKRPKRNTRKIIDLKPDSPENTPLSKTSRRKTITKKRKGKEAPIPKKQHQTEAEQTESESTDSSIETTSPQQTTSAAVMRKVKKEKEKKPRKSKQNWKTKEEKDFSPPHFQQIQSNESQLSDTDEEFIEDPVADIMEEIKQERNHSSEQRVNKIRRKLAPTTLADLTAPPAQTSSSLLPKSDDLNSPNPSTKPGIVYILGERHFVCDQCPRVFNRHGRMLEHKRVHSGEKPFTCDECGKKFRIRLLLKVHKLRHSEEKQFNCEICNLGCSTRNDLNMHMRHHTNDRRFQCTMCPKAFVRGPDLKIHFRVHTGEKPFVCDICNKCFRANQNLSAHKKSHMGEASKTYKCEQCDKKFMRNIDRKVHMRSHTGEKPFKCDICDRAYSSAFNLKAHAKRAHTSAPPRSRKKPGPKTKVAKELEKQKKLIEDLQAQLKRKFKNEEMIIPDNHAMQDSSLEENIMETETDTTQAPGFEIIYSPKLLQKKPAPPATIKQNLKQPTTSSSSASMGSITPAPQKQTTTKVVTQKTSLGIQQVSVTVSMQVENVATNSATTEKQNTTSISNMQITATSVPPTSVGVSGSSSVKKERKITSYFRVLDQKAEV